MQQVDSFKCLVSLVTWNGSITGDIKSRISMVKRASEKVKRLLIVESIRIHLRRKLARCYIWLVVLHGCETWSIKKKGEGHLERFKMWLMTTIKVK